MTMRLPSAPLLPGEACAPAGSTALVFGPGPRVGVATAA
jgi:hypothetical protein